MCRQDLLDTVINAFCLLRCLSRLIVEVCYAVTEAGVCYFLNKLVKLALLCNLLRTGIFLRCLLILLHVREPTWFLHLIVIIKLKLTKQSNHTLESPQRPTLYSKTHVSFCLLNSGSSHSNAHLLSSSTCQVPA